MKRVDRRRSERRRQALLIVGLSFAVGALSAIALTWRLAESEPAAPVTSPTAAEIAALEAVVATHDELPPPVEGRRDAAPAVRPAATSGSEADRPDVELLRRRDLKVPVDGVDDDDLRDSFTDARGGRSHEAIDIMASRGTPVLSVEDGHVAKLFNSKQGGLTVYVFDPTNTYCYYYAHLDRYADGLKEGQTVKRGQVIGTVGSTGNAAEDAPHLHFAIFRLTPERQWSKGTPINPYLVLK